MNYFRSCLDWEDSLPDHRTLLRMEKYKRIQATSRQAPISQLRSPDSFTPLDICNIRRLIEWNLKIWNNMRNRKRNYSKNSCPGVDQLCHPAGISETLTVSSVTLSTFRRLADPLPLAEAKHAKMKIIQIERMRMWKRIPSRQLSVFQVLLQCVHGKSWVKDDPR